MKTMLKGALLAGIAAVPMTVPVGSAAQAQTANRNYSIAAQPLDDALRQFASQSGRDVVFDPKLVEGKTSTALQGSFNTEAGLRQLLKGTGVSAFSTSNGFAIRGNGGAVGGSADPTDPALQLTGSATMGAILDSRTGAALKGALVELVSTGDKTATDDFGEFRFPGKNGSFRIRISYLGYPETVRSIELKNGRPTGAIFLADGGEPGEIVVTAARSARAQALNLERTNDNSTTIISSDHLGQFNGNTIAEAMRRAPGVSFERDEYTGDGTNVIIRGLPSEFNQTKLNGQQLPVGSGRDRNQNLGNVLADSVSKITINKTLTAAQDSSGTGGLIEIETASPLDRPKRYASFTVEGVRRGKGFGSDYSIAGTLSGRFGADENFGLLVSYQRRKQDVQSVGYSMGIDLQPSYLPLDVDGTPISEIDFIDPRTPFPFEPGAAKFFPYAVSVTSTSASNTTSALNIAADWKPFEGTKWSIDFLSSEKESDRVTNVATLSALGFYVPTPIPSLDGEVRYARNLFFGVAGASTFVQQDDSRTRSVSFRGDSQVGRWDFQYRAGYSSAAERTPLAYNVSLGNAAAALGSRLDQNSVLPEAIDPTTGVLTSFFGERTGSEFPKVLLNEQGLSFIGSPSLTYLGTSISSSKGRSKIWTGDFSTKRDISNSILKFVEAGLNLRSIQSGFRLNRDITYSPIYDFTTPPYAPLISSVGLAASPIGYGGIIGDGALFNVLDEDRLPSFIDGLPQLAEDGVYVREFVTTPRPPTSVREREVAGYVQAKLQIGKLDALVGVRLNRINVKSEFLSGPELIDANGVPDAEFRERFLGMVSAEGSQQNILPRFLINYRPSESSVLRLGYYSTVTRPRIDQLAGVQGIVLDLQPYYGPSFNQPRLLINKANPGLKDSYAHNFDLSFEKYFGSIGAIKASAFYKLFTNVPESVETRGTDSLDGVDLPDDPRFDSLPANIFVSVVQPFSSPYKAKSWGAELSLERQLDFITARFKGLYAYINYTYSDSSKVLPLQWFSKPVLDGDGNIVARETENYIVRDVPFNNQPKHSGTLGLTYSRHKVDASLYYTLQSRSRTEYGRFGLHQYDEGSDTLDFRIQYSMRVGGADARFYLIGNDLLKGRNDARVQQSFGGADKAPKFYSGGSFLGGREFSAGMSVTF